MSTRQKNFWIYFLTFVALFATEVAIAVFTSGFIRTFVGDVLVVILLYCFVAAFFTIERVKLAIGVLVFAFAVEVAQYFEMVTLLGLEKVKIARIVMGTTFDEKDLVAYVLGFMIILFVETIMKKSYDKNVCLQQD